MAAVVDRLYRCLVEAINQTRSEGLDSPVTVAEIYQDLVPYRAVRSVLQVELNADYEHALLKLLAGENGYARLEPEDAQEELRRELRSSNPNLGLFRKFAACDVWVRRPHSSAPQPAEKRSPEADAETNTSDGPASAAAPAQPVAKTNPAETQSRGNACAFCGQQTPAKRQVRFCPFCGADQEKRPCPACGEVLEVAWKFCIRCGQNATSPGT